MYDELRRRAEDALAGSARELARLAGMSPPAVVVVYGADGREIVVSVPNAEGVVPDGPVPPHRFRWGPRDLPVPPREWQCLYLAFQHRHLAVEALVTAIWGAAADVPDATVRGLVHRANVILLEARCPFELRLRKGVLILDDEYTR